MPAKVDLYDGEYGNYESDVYRQVRIETYGVDFGQTSWVTTEESTQIPGLLGLTSNSSVLEIGCGSGVYALHIAKTIGCSITGLDINGLGIDNANQLALQRGLHPQAHFEVCDVSKPLPFADETFDAIFSNDVLCHIPGRPALLAEMYRVLKTGGRMLFSDALIIGGIVSQDEIATRSSIGYYLFSPPGENERLIQQAGFGDLKVVDTTGQAAVPQPGGIRPAEYIQATRTGRRTKIQRPAAVPFVRTDAHSGKGACFGCYTRRGKPDAHQRSNSSIR